MFDGMGSVKLNDMSKTWYGHKNCSSHFGVDNTTINIVDRPANKGKKKLITNIQRKTSKVTRGRSGSGINRMHSIRNNTPCCIDKNSG
jgi:hypothetical protein